MRCLLLGVYNRSEFILEDHVDRIVPHAVKHDTTTALLFLV
jgi:hypothetical protein